MLGAHPVPLLQTMRKTVVDGSNTSGFQRTTLVATDGVLETDGGPVGIDVLCLEEDSARKLDSELTPTGEVVTWNLDRLGIPLIEIATAPDVKVSRSCQTNLNCIRKNTCEIQGEFAEDLVV